MTLAAYFAAYGETYRPDLEPAPRPKRGPRRNPSPWERSRLDAGMLQFTEESAPSWGGAYPGNFAHVVLRDHREDLERLTREAEYVNKIKASMEAGTRRIADSYARPLLRKPRHAKGQESALLRREIWEEGDAQWCVQSFFWLDNAHVVPDRPFSLRLYGTGNTTYQRTFATEAEAREFWALLDACQPLDLFLDIHPNFAGTN